MLEPADMCEFTSLERCAAYVAARSTLAAVQRMAPRWPTGLGDHACRLAIATAQQIAAAIAHGQATAERRHHLRGALASALGVAAALDVSREAYRVGDAGDAYRTGDAGDAYRAGDAGAAYRAGEARDDELDDLVCLAGRTIALLGMLLHASTAPGVPQRVSPRQEGTTRDQRARRK